MARKPKYDENFLKGKYEVINPEALDKRANDETGKFKNRGIFSRLIKKCKTFDEYLKLVGDTQVQDEGSKPVSGKQELVYFLNQGVIEKVVK